MHTRTHARTHARTHTHTHTHAHTHMHTHTHTHTHLHACTHTHTHTTCTQSKRIARSAVKCVGRIEEKLSSHLHGSPDPFPLHLFVAEVSSLHSFIKYPSPKISLLVRLDIRHIILSRAVTYQTGCPCIVWSADGAVTMRHLNFPDHVNIQICVILWWQLGAVL